LAIFCIEGKVASYFLLFGPFVAEVSENKTKGRESNASAVVARDRLAQIVRDDGAGHTDDNALADLLGERHPLP
jgi:hypothetical protein